MCVLFSRSFIFHLNLSFVSFRCVPLLYGCVVVAFANSGMMIVYITGQSIGASDS